MSQTWALIPVKAPEQSKTRLLSVLQPDECARLSRAMLMDVLAALEDTPGIDRIALLTNDDEIADIAAQLGHEVIRDQDDSRAANNPENILCSGLNEAARHIAAQGAEALLVIPGDLPTLTAADIQLLLERHAEGLSLCPAIRDGGTNALVCSPPDAIDFQFGKDSAQRHLDTANSHGIKALRMAIPAFFRDIDIPDDLVWLSAQPSAGNTVKFLRQSGIFARVGQSQTGVSA